MNSTMVFQPVQDIDNYITPKRLDSDNNGLDNAYEDLNGLTPVDADLDGTPGYLDLTNDSTSISNENEVEVFNVLTLMVMELVIY